VHLPKRKASHFQNSTQVNRLNQTPYSRPQMSDPKYQVPNIRSRVSPTKPFRCLTYEKKRKQSKRSNLKMSVNHFHVLNILNPARHYSSVFEVLNVRTSVRTCLGASCRLEWVYRGWCSPSIPRIPDLKGPSRRNWYMRSWLLEWPFEKEFEGVINTRNDVPDV